MMHRQRGFTLLEMVLVVTIFAILIGVVFTAYSRMIRLKVDVEARQILMDRSYFLMEKLQVMMADYTIDYEEYYNRKIVGCDDAGVWGTGGVNGSCDLMTYHGNGYNHANSLPLSCSSTDDSENSVISSADCAGDRGGKPQSYLSYQSSFWDRRADVDTVLGVVGDEDDRDLGIGPVAIAGDVSELYLISYDGTKRLWLRRKMIGSGDRNGDGTIDDTEKLYSIQQLQLQGVDAGYDHNFEGEGAFDGTIDTWRCDAAIGYLCGGDFPTGSSDMLTLYQNKNYRPVVDVDDGWVDVFGSDITVTDRSLTITPDTSPSYAWADDDKQISPSVTINLTAQLYAEHWSDRLGDVQVSSFSLPLQTTFSIKQFYR